MTKSNQVSSGQPNLNSPITKKWPKCLLPIAPVRYFPFESWGSNDSFVFIVPEREPAAMKHKQIDADKVYSRVWASSSSPSVSFGQNHWSSCMPHGVFYSHTRNLQECSTELLTATCFQALEEQTAVSVNPVCPYGLFPLVLFYFRRGFLSSPNVDVDACMHLDTGEDTALSWLTSLSLLLVLGRDKCIMGSRRLWLK